jgi:TonB-dependent receptor
LPALGLVWTVTPKWNLRLNYGETITRPSFRELAGIRTYDPVLDEYVVGNPNLEMTAVKNYDARLEWFPRPGELFSIGVFYKDLANVIEKEFISSAGDIITFVNRPEAKVYGIEFEARKSLEFLSYPLRHWSLGGNLSLLESEQPVSELQKANHTKPELLGETRPMADQSPYIINLELAYDNPAWGTSLSLSYNVFGPRLIIANLAAPDIYEQPVEQLDLVLAQRIGRNLRLKIGARNLLNPRIERTYGEDSQAIYSSYTRGRTYGLSLNYEF